MRCCVSAGRLIAWLEITASKFYDWRERYGKMNEHNGWVPWDFWLEEWEKRAIIGFHLKNPGKGYQRLTLMMLDADIVERQAVEEVHGLRAAADGASTLAHRRVVHQHQRDVSITQSAIRN